MDRDVECERCGAPIVSAGPRCSSCMSRPLASFDSRIVRLVLDGVSAELQTAREAISRPRNRAGAHVSPFARVFVCTVVDAAGRVTMHAFADEDAARDYGACRRRNQPGCAWRVDAYQPTD